MTCKICETRRPRRYCPGVSGDICSLCCGTEREVTVGCPLDCEYLRDARKREKPQPMPAEQLPHPDVRITERFVHDNGALISQAMATLVNAAVNTPGAVDSDVREALEALVRTYRTRESGLYYDSRPNNLIAAGIYERLAHDVEEFRQRTAEQTGMTKIRDADVLGVLVFLARTAMQLDNGRRKGRAFLDLVRRNVAPERSSSLVVP